MSETQTVDEGPKGFGGWLILPIIGLVISPFTMGFSFFSDLLPVLTSDLWAKINDKSLPGHQPMLAPLIIYEVVVNVAMIAFTLFVMFFFFQKSRRTPRLYIIWLILLAAMQIVDAMLASSAGVRIDGQGIRDLVRSVAAAAIWVPYFLVSRRVKNTFVE